VSGAIVEVSSRRFEVPFECPCCGADPDAELAIPLTRTAGREPTREAARALVFPYCKRCVGHVELWESAGLRSAGLVVAGLLVAVVVVLASGLVIGAIAFAAVAVLAWTLGEARRVAARAGMGPSCASPARALAYLGWSGRASVLSFESPTYAARFAEQNEKRLVDVTDQLRKLIEGHRIARLAVPTPAAPHLVVPPPARVDDWLARIEASRSTVERRNALRRALDVTHDGADRARLLEAASRLELAPLLGAIDALASIAAKKHRLQRALDDLRSDNIPEELQEAEVRQLEAKLRELG
jgi:hypothetical protein